MNIKIIITSIALAASTGLQAQSFSAPLKVNGGGNEANNYFTAVILSDPHVEQTGHDGASVGTYKEYCQAIINLGKDGATGKQYQFNALPGYKPKADIVFCLGDMDQDSEKSGANFKAAFHKLNAAGIPFVTMLGNHDAVPDYWTGDNPDKGLTLGTIFGKGGSECNDVAMNLVRAQVDTAKTHGISDVEWITDGSKHTQLSPFTFTFQGVRFYCGQAYWFQKPYDKPKTALGSANYYAPDGVISALETFVDKHTDEPSVWMQHYPFTYGSDCDRWWLDQNDVGKYIATKDKSEYGTDISSLGKYDTDETAKGYAKKKKDKLADIIKRTKNAVHFSGHVHSYGDFTYDGVRDYTVAAPAISSGGMFLVLMSKTDGVVEVKKIDLADLASNQADSIGVIDNTDKVTLSVGADVTPLLGTNLDFEITQADASTNATNIHGQPGWSHVWSVDATSNNVQYTQAYQVTDQQSGASTKTALRLRSKWQKNAVNNYIFKEAKLPAGNYTLTYHINKAATDGISEDLCYYEIGGKRAPLPATTGNWSKQTVNLSLPKADTLRLNFGYRGGAGSKEALVYVDDIQLTYNSAYQPDDQLGRNTREVSGANLWNPVKTSFVQNGSFDNGTTGWSYTTGAQNHGTTTNKDDKVVYLAFENWSPSLQASKMCQTVSDIPSGTYMLDITAWADNMEGKQVYMGNNTLPLEGTAGEANNYRIVAYLDGNQTEVGLEATTAAGSWMGIDNVQLTYWGKDDIVEEVKAKLLADADIDADRKPQDSYARYTEPVTLGDWTTTNHTTNKGQHWDGTSTSSYHEQKDGWGSNAWSTRMEQNISLPAGRYVLKVACRAASAKVDARISVDDKSVLAPTNDDYGLGIDTQGNTNWDATGTYANANKGRGWEWRYLPFTVTETSTHTIALSATVTDGLRHWVSFSDVQLLKVPSVTIDENTTFVPTSQEAGVTLLRTFNTKAWNSLVVPFAIDDENAKRVFGPNVTVCNYTGSTRNDDGTYTLNFTTSTDGIRANTPVFIHGVSTTAPYRFENAQIEVPTNNVTAQDDQSGTFSFIGSYTVPSPLSAGDWFISSDNKFYRANGQETMRGTRAVFRPTKSAAALSKMSVDDTPTDIQGVILPLPATDALYNLQGQKMTTAPAHGVFISNGHKVVR